MDAHKHLASDMETTDPAPRCGCTATEIGDDCVPCRECERIIHQDETAHGWGWDLVFKTGKVRRLFLCDDCYNRQPEVVAGVELEARLRREA